MTCPNCEEGNEVYDQYHVFEIYKDGFCVIGICDDCGRYAFFIANTINILKGKRHKL